VIELVTFYPLRIREYFRNNNMSKEKIKYFERELNILKIIYHKTKIKINQILYYNLSLN